jgi:hypothetical protein
MVPGFDLSSGEAKENIPINCPPSTYLCDVFPYTLQQASAT